MTLPFSLIINRKKNYFIAKIWRSILTVNPGKNKELTTFFQKLSEEDQSKIDLVKPKYHTIRRDESDLWKKGMDIHPVISDNSLSPLQFAPTLKCLDIQMISIDYTKESVIVVTIDGKILSFDEVKTLAVNDGFDKIEDFYSYFNDSFKGKLIHWTDLRY
jgi:hypothetical protein